MFGNTNTSGSFWNNNNQQNNNLAGSFSNLANTDQSSNFNFGTFGMNSSSSTQNQSLSGNTFMNTGKTNLFGSNQQSLFGQTNTLGSTSLFGNTGQTNSLFGSNMNNTNQQLGTTTGTGLFGSSTNVFGSDNKQTGGLYQMGTGQTQTGFSQISGNEVATSSNFDGSTIVNVAYGTTNSQDEYRWEFYRQNDPSLGATPGMSLGTTTGTLGTGLFGSTTTQPSTGLFGSTTTQPSTGLFGSTTTSGLGTTTLGGTTGTGLFGSTTTTQPSTGLFGSTTTTQPSTGLFGSTTTTGLGSSNLGTTTSSGLFGSTTTTQPSTGLFGSTTTGSTFGTSTGSGLFGSTTQPATGTGLFGSTTNTGLGSTTTGTGLFGSTTTTQPSTGLFGSATTTQPSTGLFGTASNTGFGSTTTQPSTGLFGSTTTTGLGSSTLGGNTGTGLFGSTTTTQPSTGLFGSTTTTQPSAGLFGSTTTTGLGSSTLGTTTGTGLFGSSTTPGFGTSSSFGTTGTTGGGLFGSTTTTQPSTGLFGSTTTGTGLGGTTLGGTSTGLFGTTPTTTGFGTSTGLFGSGTTGSGLYGTNTLGSTYGTGQVSGLYGTGFGQTGYQTQGTGLFGTNTLGSGLFGTGPSFGSFGVGGQYTPGTGVFGGPLTSLNGNPNMQCMFSLGGMPLWNLNVPSPGLTSFWSQGANLPPEAADFLNRVNSLNNEPYQYTPYQFVNRNYSNQATDRFGLRKILTDLGVALPRYYVNPQQSSILQSFPNLHELMTNNNFDQSPKEYRNGVENEDYTGEESQQTHFEKLRSLQDEHFKDAQMLKYYSRGGQLKLIKDTSNERKSTVFSNQMDHTDSMVNKDSDTLTGPFVRNRTKTTLDPLYLTRVDDEEFQECDENNLDENKKDKENKNKEESPQMVNHDDTPRVRFSEPPETTNTGLGSSTLGTSTDSSTSGSTGPSKNPPVLTKEGYSTRPTMESLGKMSDKELSSVVDFQIIRDGFGDILWPGHTDLRGVNLDELVDIGYRKVTVNWGDEEVPPVGKGLNKPALITVYNCTPTDFDLRSVTKQLDKIEKIKEYTESCGCKFISFNFKSGVWMFETPYFVNTEKTKENGDRFMSFNARV